jgi:hypothetical protein
MKKTLILLSIILLFTAFTPVKAQEKIKFGIKTGFNLNTLTSPNETFSFRPGFSAGAFFQYKVSDFLGIGIEPAFALTGANKIDPLAIHFADELSLNDVYGVPFKQHNLKFTTSELPLLVVYYMKVGSMGLKFIAGASFNYIFATTQYSFKEDVTIDETWLGNSDFKYDVSERFDSYDIPGIIGAGTEFPVGKLDLSVDFRYHHGFMNINNVVSKPKLTTRGFSLNVCVGLNKLIIKK